MVSWFRLLEKILFKCFFYRFIVTLKGFASHLFIIGAKVTAHQSCGRGACVKCYGPSKPEGVSRHLHCFQANQNTTVSVLAPVTFGTSVLSVISFTLGSELFVHVTMNRDEPADIHVVDMVLVEKVFFGSHPEPIVRFLNIRTWTRWLVSRLGAGTALGTGTVLCRPDHTSTGPRCHSAQAINTSKRAPSCFLFCQIWKNAIGFVHDKV